MKLKIIGTFVCILLIATTLPNISGNVIKKTNFDDIQLYDYVPGEFIAKFTEDTKIFSPSVSVLNEKYQVISMEKVFINSENTILKNIYILKISENSDILSIIGDYSSNPNVVYAEPNYIVHTCMTPNDPFFDLQWALHNTGQTGGTPDADIDAPEAWDIETGDENIVIAISDTGVDWDHPDLSGNIWINSDESINGFDIDDNGFIDDIRGWDFVNDDNDPMDDEGHGTSCAGIASAVTDNNIGIAGVCWNCKIMPVKGLNNFGWGLNSDLANSIVYATDNGADVISMSWGSLTNFQVIEDALNYSYSQGVVLVAAAGNDNTDDKFYPAAYDNVISVAAINDKDIKINLSNYGYWVNVAAPGWDVYTTDLDDDYTYFSFTSCATPHVAGLAAMILSRNNSLSQVEVKSIICENVDPYDSEEYIGTGRINAYKALTEGNQPPYAPDITGASYGSPGTSYDYSFKAKDTEGEDVRFFINWGDDKEELTSFVASDTYLVVSHTWADEGEFTITAYAEDTNGFIGPETTKLVTMPRNKITNNILVIRFFDQFRILQKHWFYFKK